MAGALALGNPAIFSVEICSGSPPHRLCHDATVVLRPNMNRVGAIGITNAQNEIFRSFALEDKRRRGYLNNGTGDAPRRTYRQSQSPPPPPPYFPMMMMAHRRSSLLDALPVELLFLVKDHMPEIDLRTHVCFSQVCGPAAETLYSETYWERASVRFGLSLACHEDVAHVSWRNFIYDVIKQDGFCEHPHCGVRRLEQNCECPLVSGTARVT